MSIISLAPFLIRREQRGLYRADGWDKKVAAIDNNMFKCYFSEK